VSGRINRGGNYCGHVPGVPRVSLRSPVPDKFPQVIITAVERLTKCYDNFAVLPGLGFSRYRSGNFRARQVRSERREAVVLTLIALLRYTELSSMRVGVPTDDGFHALSAAYLAEQAGLSLQRFQRAISYLKRRGFVSVHQPRYLNEDGEIRGQNAIRLVNTSLFNALGLKNMLHRARGSASKRIRIMREKAFAATGRVVNPLSAVIRSLKRFSRPRSQDPPGSISERRRVNELAANIVAENPNISIKELRKMLEGIK